MLEPAATAPPTFEEILTAMDQTPLARELAEDFRRNPQSIREISPISFLPHDNSWLIATQHRAFLLRILKSVGESMHYLTALGLANLASKAQLAPELLGWSQDHKILLTEFIPAQAAPPYAITPAPYLLALRKLQTFHRSARETIQPHEVVAANIPWNAISRDLGNLQWAAPPELWDAAQRIDGLFREVEPWLISHATIIHGNFRTSNLRFIQQLGGWQVYCERFDRYLVGHPYFDVAKFCLPFTSEERSHFLCHYLAQSELAEEDRRHFDICHSALLLEIAFGEFRSASAGLQGGNTGFSAEQMWGILSTNPSPTLAETWAEPSTVVNHQLRGIAALREIFGSNPPWSTA